MKQITKTSNQLQTTPVQRLLMLSCLVFVASLSGCASSGTLEPHHAFRQAASPFQAAYYQGQPTGLGQNPYSGGIGAAPAGDFGSFGGYNSQPAFGQTNPALLSGVNPQYQPQFPPQNQPNVPAAGYNYQPAYSGGFSSGSC